MATIAALATAAAGAYSANQQAKAANKSKTTTTNQTSTQNPFLYDAYAPDIGEVLAQQRGISAQGAPQVGPNGQIYYANQPRSGAPDAGGAGFTSGATTAAPKSKADKTYEAQRAAYLAAGGNPKDQAAFKAFKKSGAGNTAATSPSSAAPRPPSAEQMFQDIYQRGVAAGDTPLIGQGRTAMGNILGASGGGGPEETGFEGYNPILNRLTGTLEGDVDQRTARDLLLQYLDPGSFAGGVGGAGSGGSAQDRATAARLARGGATFQQSGGGGGGGSFSSTVSGVPVPDAAGSGLFGTEVRKVFDEQANQAELEDLIRLMNEDTEKGMYRDIASLDAAAIGGGRFGGDMWKGMSSDAREQAAQEMAKSAAGVRVGDRDARRNAILAALGQVNTRDLGSLQAQTQLEIADRNASAAGAGAAQAAALQRRGQDLSALGMLFNDEQFSLGQLGDVGSQLSGDRLSTLGMIPGLEGIGLSGLNIGLGAGGGMVDLQQIAAQDAASRRSAGVARAGQAQQLGMFNAGQQQNAVDNYLATLQRIGGMGGTSTTQGTNVVPGAGISPTGAAVAGGVGGFMQGYGTAKQYGW